MAKMKKRVSKPTPASETKPRLKENVGKGTKEDVKRVAKGATGKSASAKKAAVRAGKRLAGRAGAVGAAGAAGFAIGSAIERKTGIGKKVGSFLGGIKQDLSRNKATVAAKRKRK